MRKNAFTLLELLIALALFAGAMVPLLWALNQGFFASRYSEYRQIASQLALNEMEDLERASYERWENVEERARGPVNDFPFYESEVVVTYPKFPDRNLKEARVTVYWTDQGEHSVSLGSYFVNNPGG